MKVMPFNPGSGQHIADRLKEKYGWEPVEFTDTGIPSVTEDVLKDLPYPEAKPLIEYQAIEKTLGQLANGKKSWLKFVSPDGRVHGRVPYVQLHIKFIMWSK
jgi:hypothetical protein